jgi:superfamily II DNA helicase RecQ
MQEHFIAGNRDSPDPSYIDHQIELLQAIKDYMYAKTQCRRSILLRYFGDDPPDTCRNCDNCTGHILLDNHVSSFEQVVQKEAFQMFELMESITRKYGATMYINILRGSAAKAIPDEIKRKGKCKYYGAGKNHQVKWWKELVDQLLEKGLLESICVGGNFGAHIIQPSKEGQKWKMRYELASKGIGECPDLLVPMSNSC